MSAALSIPEPRADDDEDVHWALSTATALCARGEAVEALKWLRRAAENASDANRDVRALELFKAAADFNSALQAMGLSASTPPPAPVAPAVARTPAHTQTSAAAQQQQRGGAPPNQTTVMAQRSPAGRSNPPPPPRGRSQPDGAAPHVTAPLAVVATAHVAIKQAADDVMEAVAPTIPGPRPANMQMQGPPTAPFPQGVTAPPSPAASAPPATPDRISFPSSPTPFAAPPAEFKTAKTLASNMSFDAFQAAADARAAAMKGAAAAPVTSTEDPSRAGTNPGIGPEHARQAPSSSLATPGRGGQAPAAQPTQHLRSGSFSQRTAQPLGSTRSPAHGPSSSSPATTDGTPTPRNNSAPAAASGAARTTAAPGARAPTERPPVSRGTRRRATMSGRRVGSTPSSSAQHNDQQQKSETRPATARFEDEITIERDLTIVQRTSLPNDLDENTNVLSGQEAFVEVVPGNAAQPDPSDAPTPAVTKLEAQGTEIIQVTPAQMAQLAANAPATPSQAPSTRPAPPNLSAMAAEFGSLSAYRVAIATEPTQGRIDAIPLAPGEPVPAGRVAVVIVATDVASSYSLADLFAKVRANLDGRSQQRTRK